MASAKRLSACPVSSLFENMIRIRPDRLGHAEEPEVSGVTIPRIRIPVNRTQYSVVIEAVKQRIVVLKKWVLMTRLFKERFDN